MVVKKIDGKEALELKRIYNHYLDKRNEIMNSTIISNVNSNDSISTEEITKLNNFLAKMM